MVLLVVDAQKQIMTESLYCCERLVGNIKTLIDTARKNGIEVIYIRHDDGIGKPLTKGTEGFEVHNGLLPQDGEMVFDKTVNSPFKSSGLLQYLREKNIGTIIVTGLQTDYCIDATVKCGFEHGFDVIVPAFCNSTFDNEFMSAEATYRYYNEFMWKSRYAKCISLEEPVEMMKK